MVIMCIILGASLAIIVDDFLNVGYKKGFTKLKFWIEK